jgi:predicted dehydrogenase
MTEFEQYSALVIGSGSIGRRHLRNLHALGIRQLYICDVDRERCKPMVEELGVIAFTDATDALVKVSPNLVFVCTPPVFHVDQAMQGIAAGAHVFIEKPLSDKIEGIDAIIAESSLRGKVVQVGYNLRFHSGIQKVKEMLAANRIGKILWAHVEAAQYLPDWRPWQDYRQSYTARRGLGGGIILDGSHEIDYIMWFLGVPNTVMCMAGTVSDLAVDVEDCATILLRFPNGAQADIHLDFVQRDYTRYCKLVGELGTIEWNYSLNQIRIYDAGTKSWKTENYIFDANDMYILEVRHFLDCIELGLAPSVGVEQALSVLRVALAAKSLAVQK